MSVILSVRRHGPWVVQFSRAGAGEDYEVHVGLLVGHKLKRYGSASGPDRDEALRSAISFAEDALVAEHGGSDGGEGPSGK